MVRQLLFAAKFTDNKAADYTRKNQGLNKEHICDLRLQYIGDDRAVTPATGTNFRALSKKSGMYHFMSHEQNRPNRTPKALQHAREIINT